MKVLYKNITEQEALALYDCYLAGHLPKAGSLIVEGVRLLCAGDGAAEKGRDAAVSFGQVQSIATTFEEDRKALSAWREYLAGRPVPAFAAVIVTPAGVLVTERGHLEGGEPLTMPAGLLEEVMTAAEAAKVFAVKEKEILSAIESGSFRNFEARKSGNVFLVTKQGMQRVFEGKESEPYPLLPLRIIFSTVEAAELWNRDAGYVRSSAGGAGHMAARMNDSERRKSGRTWLVTREAMERVFGFPDAEKMRALMDGLEDK